MLGRGRPRRVYRVYADEDFLRDDEPGLADPALDPSSPRRDDELGLADPALDPSSPRRGLRGAFAGRSVGIVLLALVAMAVSAIVVHAVRVGLSQGGGLQRPVPAVSGPARTTPATRGGPSGGGVVRGRQRPARATDAAVRSVGGGPVGRASGESSRRGRSGAVAASATSGASGRYADRRAATWAPPDVPDLAPGETAGTEEGPAGPSEFGFER
jgi:hypothetical protein